MFYVSSSDFYAFSYSFNKGLSNFEENSILSPYKKCNFNALYLFPQQYFIEVYLVLSPYFGPNNLPLAYVPIVMNHPVCT